MNPARSRFLGLAGVALAGLLALVTSAQPWWRAEGSDAGVTFTGTDATAGLSQALGAVALAGFLLGLTLRGRGRQVLAGLLGLLGIAIVVVGGFRFRPDPEAVRARLQQVSLATEYALTGTPWPIGYVAAGVLLLAAAVLILVTAPSWPTRSDRFRRGRSTGPAGGVAAEPDPIDLWKAMDSGADPTVADDPDSPTSDPDPGGAEPAQPESTQPESTQPESTQPESTQPESTQPESTQPEPAQPEPAQPEPAQPEPAEPAHRDPGSGRSESR